MRLIFELALLLVVEMSFDAFGITIFSFRILISFLFIFQWFFCVQRFDLFIYVLLQCDSSMYSCIVYSLFYSTVKYVYITSEFKSNACYRNNCFRIIYLCANIIPGYFRLFPFAQAIKVKCKFAPFIEYALCDAAKCTISRVQSTLTSSRGFNVKILLWNSVVFECICGIFLISLEMNFITHFFFRNTESVSPIGKL